MKGTVAVRFTAAIEPSFDAAFDVWERMAEEGDALPFQRRPWLAAWASTIGRGPELDLLPVTVRDSAGAPIAGIPLVRERRGLRRIGFADGGLVDYNAPILGRNVPQDRDGAARLWAALRHVLPPGRHDLPRADAEHASGRGRTRWRCCPTRCRRGRWASR